MACINGEIYGWSSVTMNIAGEDITGITAINYKEEQKMENVYGAGSRPIGRSYGQISTTASVTLILEEVERIRQSSHVNSLREIPPFEVTVQYAKGNNIVTHHLRRAQFKNEGVALKENDTRTLVTLELVVCEIEWNRRANRR